MKKIFTMMCALVLSITLFAGCNVLELNTDKYYTDTVAIVQSKDTDKEYTFNKKELMDAFYSYSAESVQSGSVSFEEGVKSAMNSMIENKLLVEYIKANFFSGDSPAITINQNDKNSIKKEAFDYMQQQITELEKQVKEEWDIDTDLTDDSDSDSQTTDSESLRDAYNEYTPSIVFENGQAIKNPNLKELDQVVSNPGDHFVQKITDQEVSKEAYVRYVAQLQSAAKMYGLSTDEKDVVLAEEQRLIDVLTKNMYLTKFETYYTDNYEFDYDEQNDLYVAKYTQEVLDYYKDQYKAQQAKYENNEALYHTDMASSPDGIYYHPNSGNEYVYVSHVLLQFSDDQKDQYSKIQDNESLTDEQKQTQCYQLALQIKTTYENADGTKIENASLTDVFNNIVNYVNTSSDSVKRAKLFNEMIYMYNDDPGIMNKDFSYIVNLDTEVEDKMVKEFADASRALYNSEDSNYGAGNMTDSIEQGELVVTENGVHIIFNAGAVQNICAPSQLNSMTIKSLFDRTTQLSSNKTIFNYIYDTIYAADFSSYQGNLIKTVKSGYEITLYEKNYKDLWK